MIGGPKNVENPERWLSRVDMARVFGCTVGNFDSRIKSLVPEKCIHKEKRRIWYYCRGVIESWAASEAAKRRPESTPEPELAGEGSPALERYRLARAKRAELDLEHIRGDLMRRSDVHEGLSEAGAVIRRHAARLVKEFGPEAGRIMADAVEDMLRTNERLFGGTDDRSSGNVSADQS